MSHWHRDWQEDFGRPDKPLGVKFQSTFQGCEYAIWDTKRWSVLRNVNEDFGNRNKRFGVFFSRPGVLDLGHDPFKTTSSCSDFQNLRLGAWAWMFLFDMSLDGCEYRSGKRTIEKEPRKDTSNLLFYFSVRPSRAAVVGKCSAVQILRTCNRGARFHSAQFPNHDK